MCDTDEYATSFFRSLCAMDTSGRRGCDHASHAISGEKYCERPQHGEVHPQMRSPHLQQHAARITDTAVGASTCASGNQVWTEPAP